MLNAGPSRERRMTEDSLGETVNAVNGIKEDTLMFKVAKQLDSSFLVRVLHALKIVSERKRCRRNLKSRFWNSYRRARKGMVSCFLV